jgi:ABC-2 type transport system permease protein
VRPALFAKLTWLEAKLFLREPLAVGFTIAYPLVVMFVIAGVFNRPREEIRGVGGAEYYVVSNIAVVIAAMGLIALPPHAASYFERGVIRRLRASSVPATAVILAQAAVCFGVAIAATVVLLGAARPASPYPVPQSVPGVVLGFVVGLISFLALGLLIAALFPTTRSAQSVGLVLFFPLYLISGAAPPLSVLPSAMRLVADFDPLNYAVRALQDPWFGYGVTVSNLVVLAAIGVVSGVEPCSSSGAADAASALSVLLRDFAEPVGNPGSRTSVAAALRFPGDEPINRWRRIGAVGRRGTG